MTGQNVSRNGHQVKLGSTFHVPAEPRVVLDKFLDAATMRACIPGCTELERPDEMHFRGRLTNEIAHVRFDAAFAVEITELRAPHRVRAVLSGEDSRLGSSLKVDAELDVVAAGDGSDVSYAMDLAMWGRLGRLGESIFRRRTAEVEQQFLAAFARACAGEDVAAAAAGPADRPAPVTVAALPETFERVPDPQPTVPGAVSAPAVSALPGVPVPAASVAVLARPAVSPDAAAAAAVASMRPLTDVRPAAGRALGRRPAVAAGLVAVLAALAALAAARRKARR